MQMANTRNKLQFDSQKPNYGNGATGTKCVFFLSFPHHNFLTLYKHKCVDRQAPRLEKPQAPIEEENKGSTPEDSSDNEEPLSAIRAHTPPPRAPVTPLKSHTPPPRANQESDTEKTPEREPTPVKVY